MPVTPSESSDSDHRQDHGSDTAYKRSGAYSPQPFSQVEPKDLSKDLSLSKVAAELLGFRLKEKNLLAKGINFYWYRNRGKEFIKYFVRDENLVYCSYVPKLMSKFNIIYGKDECMPYQLDTRCLLKNTMKPWLSYSTK
ncbi:hypothetical protein NPIL_33871 [Nephila pilipes]|uniref:Uncharacterized protein n=1 Tax=Nephila pilipes TaxID=299642 RepID=A0A8X6PZS0_NEPPI|nr:hypothetical protein NPIL_33871 [Nephila pilipes]